MRASIEVLLTGLDIEKKAKIFSDELFACAGGRDQFDKVTELLLRTDNDNPNIRSLNFMIHGVLGDGVAATTRTDGQAKSLGEYLRAKIVDVPKSLVAVPGTVPSSSEAHQADF